MKETIKIDSKRKVFSAELEGIMFADGKCQIFYIPSLQISSYGDNPKEANEMMRVSLQAFSRDLFEQTEKEVHSILKKLGWEKIKFFPKKLVSMKKMTSEEIKKEFNLPLETELKNIPIAV